MVTVGKSDLAADVRRGFEWISRWSPANLLFQSDSQQDISFPSILRWPTLLLLWMFGSAGSVGNWKEVRRACATLNWIARRLKWKQIISRLMGLIWENNSTFPQLAILHVIFAEGLQLLERSFLYVFSLNVPELESGSLLELIKCVTLSFWTATSCRRWRQDECSCSRSALTRWAQRNKVISKKKFKKDKRQKKTDINKK